LIRNIIARVDDTIVFVGTCQENTYLGWGVDESRLKESKEETYPYTTGDDLEVYQARPIKEVYKYKDSKMTWSRRRKALIRIRLGSL
jgi:hypothetical protein